MGTIVMSSSSLEDLEKMCKEWFFSSSIRIEFPKIFNAKGEMTGYRVTQKRTRYRLESIKN